MKARLWSNFAKATEYEGIGCVELEARDGRKIQLVLDGPNRSTQNRVLIRCWPKGGYEAHRNLTDLDISFELRPEGGVGPDLRLSVDDVLARFKENPA